MLAQSGVNPKSLSRSGHSDRSGFTPIDFQPGIDQLDYLIDDRATKANEKCTTIFIAALQRHDLTTEFFMSHPLNHANGT